jgi:PleD family two-component response regulator
LLSLNLPDMDGHECAKAIKAIDLEMTSQTPIVGVADKEVDEEQLKATGVSLNDYLFKPISPEALRKILLRHAYEPRRPNLKTLIPLSIEDATITPSFDD